MEDFNKSKTPVINSKSNLKKEKKLVEWKGKMINIDII